MVPLDRFHPREWLLEDCEALTAAAIAASTARLSMARAAKARLDAGDRQMLRQVADWRGMLSSLKRRDG